MGPLPDKEGNDVGGCRNRFSRPRTDTTSNNTTMAKKKSKTVSPYLFSWLGLLMAIDRLLDHGGTANASLRTRKVRHVLAHPAHLMGELTIFLGFFSVDAAPKG